MEFCKSPLCGVLGNNKGVPKHDHGQRGVYYKNKLKLAITAYRKKIYNCNNHKQLEDVMRPCYGEGRDRGIPLNTQKGIYPQDTSTLDLWIQTLGMNPTIALTYF